MKKLFALPAFLAAFAAIVAFASPAHLGDNRRIMETTVVYDSPFFPPDPSDCGDENGFCFPPAAPPAPDCAYTTSGCN